MEAGPSSLKNISKVALAAMGALFVLGVVSIPRLSEKLKVKS